MSLNYSFNYIEKILLLLIFMFSISLFNFAGYILAVVIIFFFITYGFKCKFDIRTFVLMIFAAFYFINYTIYFEIGVKEIITFALAPWCCYLIGKELNFRFKHKAGTHIFIAILVSGFFLHGVLNTYAYINTFGYDYHYRIAYDFWRNEIISVTGCALYFIPIMSFAIGVVFSNAKMRYKVISAIAFAIGLWANILYANRTPIYIVLILITIRVVCMLFQYRYSIKAYVISILVAAGMAVCWAYNIAGIKTTIYGLTITKRLTGEDIGRLPIWLDFLKSDWWKYPFGGQHVTIRYNYVHNLWLDTLWTTGYVPFVCLLIFTIMSIVTVKKYYNLFKRDTTVYIYLMVGLGISCMVEPIIDANPYYFLLIVFILGAFEGKIKKQLMENTIN